MNLKKIYLILTLLFASLGLVLAVFVEYKFNFHPCTLCTYQRYLVLLLFVVTFIGLITNHLLPSILVLALSSSLAIFHVLVEKKIIVYNSSCSSLIEAGDITNVYDFTQAIVNAEVVRCDHPQLILSQLSFAELAAFCLTNWFLIGIWIWYGKKKRKRKN